MFVKYICFKMSHKLFKSMSHRKEEKKILYFYFQALKDVSGQSFSFFFSNIAKEKVRKWTLYIFFCYSCKEKKEKFLVSVLLRFSLFFFFSEWKLFFYHFPRLVRDILIVLYLTSWLDVMCIRNDLFIIFVHFKEKWWAFIWILNY